MYIRHSKCADVPRQAAKADEEPGYRDRTSRCGHRKVGERPIHSSSHAKNEEKQNNEKTVITTDQNKNVRTGALTDNKSKKDTADRQNAAGNAQEITPAGQNDTTIEDDARKKVMRNSYKVTGFRVQAYAGGNTRQDRQTAEQVGNNIKANIPGEPVYVHFYSPRWICRVGNYRTYEEAHQMLLAIRKLGYKQASIVKGKISVQY